MSFGLLQRLAVLPRKIVIVRAGRIGDLLCATPALRALRHALPDAEITLIGLPFVRELVERSALLDRFAEFPGFPGMAEQFFDARQSVDFLRRMQNEHFDLAIQMHGSGVNANPFTLLLGARQTVGFIRPGDRSGRLNAALPLPDDGHEIHRLLALTTFLGAPPRGDSLDFPLTGEDRAEADHLLVDLPEPLIGLHPAARDATKRWNPQRFAAAATELRARHGGSIVLLGGAEERAALDVLAGELCSPVLNLAGRTSLPILGGVVRRLAVLLTNDSGPAHIAYALNTPAVVVFGSTDPCRWGPLDRERHRVLAAPVPCRPCGYDNACPIGLPCLEGVTVPQMVEAAEGVAFQREPAS